MLSSFQLGYVRAYGEEHWSQEALICPSGTFVTFGLGFLRTMGETWALQSDMGAAFLTFGASRQTLWPYL